MVAGTLRAYKNHGTGKDIDPEALADFDIVLTTYATLGSDIARQSSALKRFTWFRVVLDEGTQSGAIKKLFHSRD